MHNRELCFIPTGDQRLKLGTTKNEIQKIKNTNMLLIEIF